MILSHVSVVMVAASLLLSGAAISIEPDSKSISKAEARYFLEFQQRIKPEDGNAYRRLVKMFGDKLNYTVAELRVAAEGPASFETEEAAARIGPQNEIPPRGAVTAAQAKSRLDAVEKLNPDRKNLFRELRKRVPGATWFTTAQVENVEKVANLPEPDPTHTIDITPYKEASLRGEEALRHLHQGWRSPRIRRDWRDVLYDDDPSQEANGEKALGDLEGALFSFTRDGEANSETWNVHGAIILPYTREFDTGPKFTLTHLAFAPSVTYDRVTTNRDPSIEVNSIFYRAGLYMDFFGLQQRDARPGDILSADGAPNPAARFGAGYGFQLRAAAVYGTDLNHRAEMPGFEVDFEPRWLGQNLSLGFRSVLISKVPERSDLKDNSILEGQLRGWLHMEGGDIQDSGEAWTPVEDSFLRMGPTVQLQLAMPWLPGERAVSLTALYSYLSAISGPETHPGYFRATLAYDLFNDTDRNHRVSINASYEHGGLNFTKQEVDTFTIGLGLIF